MEQVHLLIKNAKVFNSYLKKFISANVAVKDGKFYYIDRKCDRCKGIIHDSRTDRYSHAY